MKSFKSRSSGVRRAAALATLVPGLALALSAGEAHAGPQRTWNFLTSGNGLGFQVFDTNQHKIVTFLDHPYRYTGPRADPKSDGFPRRNLAFDLYFGLRAGGTSGWLNAPTSSADAEYVDQTNIIHAPAVLGVQTDSYFFSPFDFSGNMVVALLHAPGASDGYILLNFHMGGTQDTPDSNGESVTAIAAQQAMTETGPGGGAMVYVPLSGVDHSDCQGVYNKVQGGMDLGGTTACSGNDIAPGFQKKLGADGWMAVGIGFVENAGDAAAMAKSISDWGAGRAPDKILADSQAEWDAWRKPPPQGTALCTDDQKKVWRQAETVLRMGQVREAYTSTRKNNGMMLASLPPGEWHTGWVRDGTFGTVALARSGHVAESKAALDFFMNATPVGKYKQFVSNQDYRISVVRYYGNGEEEADYSGQATPNVEIDGWGMVLWAARQYVEASGDTAWLSSATKLGPTVYQSLVSGIAKPLENNLETNGIVKADSGIWEVHDANKKHFAFTTMSAARGFCDLAALAKKLGKDADVTKYQALSAKVKAAFFGAFIDQQGALGGSLEGISNNMYYDGATAAAFTWNLLPDYTGQTATATLAALGNLKVQSGGFKRNNDGLSSYDNNEWILVDLLISNAARRAGHTAEADSYVDLVVSQAAANYYLLPELYNAVPSDGAIGKYTGSIPMVGYGGGAYLMTMLDRSGIVEPNDCGDGMGMTLPVVTCGGNPTGGGGASGTGASNGVGNGTGPSGAGGGPGATPYEGTGACLCRAGGPGSGDWSTRAPLLLLGGVPALLALRRRQRRAARPR
jgi:GH15 family glucan-1,4-alpha-glucosidase